MGCNPAPVARAAWSSAKNKWGGQVSYLGICGDSRHCPGSSDHCKGMALDIGVGNNAGLGWAIYNAARKDRRCKYVIFKAQGRRADWRGGTGFRSKGHHTHVHISFSADRRNDSGGWFGSAPSAVHPATTAATSFVAYPGGNNWHATGKGQPMREGHSGPAVAHLQRLLKLLFGHNLQPDGKFGPKTAAAVRAAQAKLNLAQDGIVGPKTYVALEKTYYAARPQRNGNSHVAAFQRHVGASPDGIWGPKTNRAASRRRNWVGWKKRAGNRKALVRFAQEQLKRVYGGNITVDGKVGPQTNHYIVVSHGESDGILGPNGWKRLLHK